MRSKKIFGTYSLEFVHGIVRRFLNNPGQHTRLWLYHDVSVRINRTSLKLFSAKGTKCALCNRAGVVYRAELNKGTNEVCLNLRTADGVLMTKDHIKPVSLGGKNGFYNLQPMCLPCNERKGASYEQYDTKVF